MQEKGFSGIMQAHFIKLDGHLVPATDRDRLLLDKIKTGEAVKMTLKRVRNYRYHKKYFALLNFAFDIFEPEQGEKNFDRFRKDIAILAGFYEQSVRLDGSIRTEAKSLAFGSMSEDEFEELFTKSIDVIIKYVCREYSGDMLRSLVDTIEAFE